MRHTGGEVVGGGAIGNFLQGEDIGLGGENQAVKGGVFGCRADEELAFQVVGEKADGLGVFAIEGADARVKGGGDGSEGEKESEREEKTRQGGGLVGGVGGSVVRRLCQLVGRRGKLLMWQSATAR